MGGISKQPSHLRYPHQVEDAQNARFSVVDGVSKRSGTWLCRKICNLDTQHHNYRLHAIDRDGSEQYLVIYGDEGGVPHTTIRAFTVGTWQEATMTISADSKTYLTGADDDDVRMLSIADQTFILNVNMAVSTVTSTSFDVTESYRDYEVMLQHSQQRYMGTGTQWDNADFQDKYARTLDDSGYYQYDTGTKTFATRRMNNNDFVNGLIDVNLWKSLCATAFYVGFYCSFQRYAITLTGATYTAATNVLSKTGAFTNYTYNVGDMIRITGGTGVTPTSTFVNGWVGITGKIDNDSVHLSEDIAAGTPADITADSIGAQYLVKKRVGAVGREVNDMDDVALSLQDELRAQGATTACISHDFNTAGDKGWFTITSPWKGADSRVFECTAPPLALTDPPTPGTTTYDLTGYPWTGQAPFKSTLNGYSDSGTGAGGSEIQDPIQRWTQVAPPGQSTADIDSLKMPLKMVRTVVGPPATFTIDTIDWTPRTSGDEFTNPTPSIWAKGYTISDMAYFRNRFWVFGGENAVGSQTDDLYNFYLDDAPTVADSDPIDVTVGRDQVAIIDYAVPLQDSLQVFTKAGQQFDLSSVEAMTPTSVRVKATTKYQTLPVRPQSIDQFLYFVGKVGCEAQVLEFPYDEASVAKNAADVTAHFSAVIGTDIRRMIVSSNQRMAYVLPTNDHVIYVYQIFWKGLEKVQSAWTKYVFDESYTICDIAAIGDQVYMLVYRYGYFVIERAHMGDEGADCTIPSFVDCTGTGTGPGSGTGTGTGGTGTGTGGGLGTGTGVGTGTGGTDPETGTGPGTCGSGIGCNTASNCVTPSESCSLCPATAHGSAICGCYTVVFGQCFNSGGAAGPCVGTQNLTCEAFYCCYTGATDRFSETNTGCSDNAQGWCHGLGANKCWEPCT